MESVVPALALFEVDRVPIVRIDMWSTKLNTWVYLVPEKTGQNPQGTFEVTPAEVKRMVELINDGWDEATAIYRTMGVRPS